MTGNRSLDEFAGGDEADEPGPAEEGGASGPAPGGEAAAPAAQPEADVEPMAETFAWSGDGTSCARCGATVEARWRDGDDLVCADCKAW